VTSEDPTPLIIICAIFSTTIILAVDRRSRRIWPSHHIWPKIASGRSRPYVCRIAVCTIQFYLHAVKLTTNERQRITAAAERKKFINSVKTNTTFKDNQLQQQAARQGKCPSTLPPLTQ